MSDHASHEHAAYGLEPASGGPSCLAGVDPRVRVLAAVGLAIAATAAHRLPTMAAALAISAAALALARMSPGAVLRRVLPLEIVILLLAIVLFWTGGQTADLPGEGRGPTGMHLAAVVALKGNAVILGLLALVGSMEPTTLGHALAHLHVPRKLAYLLLLTIRYLEVLWREYGRLRWAMKVRSFHPRMSLHTYRSYGYLVGMMLVRSLDRSERV
ncbi:MAG: energy-coupling factor transporter transmembrane component T, partial [Thermoguttaceae bacterium]